MKPHHFSDEDIRMLFRELKELVESTADAAFAVNGEGLIAAWNTGAERMFGLTAEDAVGRPCGEILHGTDECGPICSPDCGVRRAARDHRPISNYDLQVQAPQGWQWCNISVLVTEVANSSLPYSIHILRGIDVRKRLELLMRDFIVNEAGLPAEEAKAMVATTRSPAREANLTGRELEILRLLAKGATTEAVAEQLHISRTTVNNHIQHILHKLNAHTRLEAIRRAEHAGLI
jgi:PAS domain S-box-containing protein